MLSTKTLTSAANATHYFTGANDNYYLDGDALAQERSAWYGKGATALELSGVVEEKAFGDLLRGKLPNGEQLGLKKADGEIHHRPGFDLTFSASKSASILATLGGDERILPALHRAVDYALKMIERECAQARKTTNGETVYENTRNLIVAKFLHDISREGDPQLHIHSVVMNATQRKDGEWRSLASQKEAYGQNVTAEINGFIEQVRHKRNYYGLIFRAQFASELSKLGYQIEKTGKHGFFEVSGISQKTLETYSRRGKQIAEYMETYGFSGSKAAAMATLETRRAKPKIARDNLKELWTHLAKKNGIEAFAESENCVAQAVQRVEKEKTAATVEQGDSKTRNAAELAAENSPAEHSVNNIQKKADLSSPQQKSFSSSAVTAVQYAIDHLSETYVTLREMQIIKLALPKGMADGISVDEIIDAVQIKQQAGELILVPNLNPKSSEKLFTTQTLLAQEQALLQAMSNIPTQGKPLLEAKKVSAYLAQNEVKLTIEQRRAVRTLMANPHTIGILEGSAGSGKTFLLPTLTDLADMAGLKPQVLTVSGGEKQFLQNELKRTSATLRQWFKQLFATQQLATVGQFLYQPERFFPSTLWGNKPPLLIVENAQTLGAKALHALMVEAEKRGGRLLLTGNKQSALTWQAGTPFTQLIDQGAACAVLKEGQRAIAPLLKSALTEAQQKNVVGVFEKLASHILAIPDIENCRELMAAHVAGLTPEERHHTRVIVPSRKHADELNAAIRTALKNEGVLKTTGFYTDVLVPKNFSRAAYRLAENYAKGQWVRFNDDYSSLNIRRGDYCRIREIQAKRNSILLITPRGKAILWNPDKVAGCSGKVEVFEEKIREIALGDTLLWRRNDKLHALHNGERLHVVDLKGDRLKLTRDNGKAVTVNLNNTTSRHFDYGHAVMPHQKSYQTTDSVIAYLGSNSPQSHQRALYQMLSQAKNRAWIYTDDSNKERLLTQLQKQTGDKTSAIESLLAGIPAAENSAATATTGNDYLRLVEKTVAEAIANSVDKELKKSPAELAQEAVSYALQHLAEREAVFDHRDVMMTALTHALGSADPDAVQAAVVAAEEKGDLIRGAYSQNGTRWTTKEALMLESRIVNLAQQDRGQLSEIAPLTAVQQHCTTQALSAEYSQALEKLLTSKDRLTLVQGFAGTGKTTLLQQVQTLAKEQGYTLICLAPTHPAVKQLALRGLTAQTLDSFLGQQERALADQKKPTAPASTPAAQPRYLLVVDEASMVSNRRLQDFLVCTHALQARAIAVGDTLQYSAIESGKPFAVLQRSAIETVLLQEIQRQKNLLLLKAVTELYQGDLAANFATLEKNFIEIAESDQRLEAISAAYLAKTPEERLKTFVISWGNKERILLNDLIRAGLKQEGALQGQEITTDILVRRDMTRVEQTRVANYQVGDILRFGLAERALGINKGDYLVVEEVKNQHGVLLLKNGNKLTLWRPPKTATTASQIEVYAKQSRQICAGDLLRWTRTDKERGFISPELVRVEAVTTTGQLELRNAARSPEGLTLDAETFTVNPNEKPFTHWDHAYAITGFSAQAAANSTVLLLAESANQKLATLAAFLVGITRVINELCIFTDNKEALLKQLVTNSGQKTSALEVMGELSKPIALDVKKTTANSQKLLEAEQTQTVAKTSQQPEPLAKTQEPLQKSFPLPTEQTDRSLTRNQQTTKSQISNHQTAPERLDAQRIHAALRDQAEHVVERLLGEPKEKRPDHYRYGSKSGSLWITLKGDKRGMWHDFQTGEGGNLLQLIARETSLIAKKDFPKVLTRAVQLLDVSEEAMRTNVPFTRQPKVIAENNNQPTAKQQGTMAYARRLARESRSIKGTLAERYLNEHRGITLQNYPKNVRFHPGVYSRLNEATKPALLVIAHDAANKVNAVQAIFLDEKTAKKVDKAEINVTKQTWGRMENTSVTVGKADSPVTLVAEGPETALSLLQAMPNAQIKITLGKENFKHVDSKTTSQHVVLCMDNDGDNPKNDQLIKTAADRLIEQGKTVYLAKPQQVKDYNDLLKGQGVDAIKNNLNNAVHYSFSANKAGERQTLQQAFPAWESAFSPTENLSKHRQKMAMKENTDNQRLLNNVNELNRHDNQEFLQKSAQFIYSQQTSLSNKAQPVYQQEVANIHNNKPDNQPRAAEIKSPQQNDKNREKEREL